MKKGFLTGLAVAVALVSPAVVADQADAAPTVTQKQMKAKTRSNVFNTYGYIYAFRAYDCMKPGSVWSCDWTGRSDGWRVDGSTFGSVNRRGHLVRVVSVMDL